MEKNLLKESQTKVLFHIYSMLPLKKVLKSDIDDEMILEFLMESGHIQRDSTIGLRATAKGRDALINAGKIRVYSLP